MPRQRGAPCSCQGEAAAPAGGWEVAAVAAVGVLGACVYIYMQVYVAAVGHKQLRSCQRLERGAAQEDSAHLLVGRLDVWVAGVT